MLTAQTGPEDDGPDLTETLGQRYARILGGHVPDPPSERDYITPLGGNYSGVSSRGIEFSPDLPDDPETPSVPSKTPVEKVLYIVGFTVGVALVAIVSAVVLVLVAKLGWRAFDWAWRF